MRHLAARVLASLLAVSAPAVAGEPAGHRIEIEVEGLAVDEVKLAYHLGVKQYIEEEHAKVEGGRVVFEGPEPLDQGVYLFVVPPNNDYFEFLVDADQHFSLRTRIDDLVGGMSVKGSAENEVFFEDLEMLGKKRAESQAVSERRDALPEGHADRVTLDAALKRIDEEVKSARRALVAANGDHLYAVMLRALQEPDVPDGTAQEQYDYYRAHFWDTVDFSDARLLRTPILESKVDRFLEKLTYLTPEHQSAAVDELLTLAEAEPEVYQFLAIKLLNRYAESKIVCMDAAYVHVVDLVYLPGKATWADADSTRKIVDRAERIRPTLCGAIAPEAALVGRDGRPVALHGIQADFTVLYVWRTRCGRCKKTGPALKEQLLALDSDRVALLTVETSDGETWGEELERSGLSSGGVGWVHARVQGSEFHEKYDIRAVPQLFLLDRDKRILVKKIDAEQLGEMLRFHLDKNE